MNRKNILLLAVISVLVSYPFSASAEKGTELSSSGEGRYLLLIAGCNDCHTKGFILAAGKIAETEWLTGDVLGWSGPWGTTYAPNLRLLLQNMSEDAWVGFAHDLKARPPMPWWTVRTMRDGDLRTLYRMIKSLGSKGHSAPAYIPPGRKPEPPYALFVMPCEPGEICKRNSDP